MRALFLFVILMLLPAPAIAQRNGMGGMGMGTLTPGTPLIGLYPAMGRADLATGVRLFKESRYGEAIPYLERALQQDQGNSGLLAVLGFAHRMNGDYATAMDFYNRALARNPDARLPHAYLGELYLAMHRMGQARSELAALTRLCPDGCAERKALDDGIAAYHRAANAASAQ